MSMLSSENEAYIEAQIASGAFASREQLMNLAVEALRKRSEHEEWLRRELQIGIDEAERGEVSPLDMKEIWAKVEARLIEKGIPE